MAFREPDYDLAGELSYAQRQAVEAWLAEDPTNPLLVAGSLESFHARPRRR